MSKVVACILTLVMFAASPVANAGDAAVPAFKLPGMDGKQHELAEWRDKVVLLNFWASWCSPCQTEIRDLVAFQTQYAAQGLQIVGIGLDDEKKLRNVQRSLGINYPVLVDNSSGPTVMEGLGNHDGVVPYSVLISRDGKVVYTHMGLLDKEIFAEEVVPRLK